MDKNNCLNVAIIGAGRIGRLHADHLARRVSRAQVVGVADVNLAAAQEVAGRLGVPRAVADYRELLDDPAVEAVAICSATDTHAAITQAAAAAGKHVFCEKPVDLDLRRIDETLQAVEQAGIKFQVGFNRRFDPNFARVRRMVEDGKIGTPHVLRITSRDPEPPPAGYVSVGIFLDMTIHDFDMARFLVGSEVTEVYAAGAVLIDPHFATVGDYDTTVITLRFDNGALGTIDNSRRAVYGYDQRVEVFGPGGMVTVTNNTPDRHIYSDASGVHSALPLYFFLERYTDSYIAEVQAFVDCVLDDTPPPVNGEDGRQSVRIGLAAEKSARENRPVALSEIQP